MTSRRGSGRRTPNPGHQPLLVHLPDVDLDLAVLRNEDAPSVDAALGALTSV